MIDTPPPTNEALEAWLDEKLSEIGGCSDGYCIVNPPKGMHTNGGCRCARDTFKMQKVIWAYKTYRKWRLPLENR